MKTNVIVIASVLLLVKPISVCMASASEQQPLSLSSTHQGKNGLLISSEHMLPANGEPSLAEIESQANLWKTIRGELKMEIPDNNGVRAQRKRLLSHKSYLPKVTSQAEPYMYWIVNQLKQRSMPMELVLLPIVESAFDPLATSNRNAAGIWQIMASTGRHYGLKQNKWYDGRRDLVASTTAALDMLQRLNAMFNGDWLLTLAAYNSGEGRVMKAIEINRAKGLATDFWHLSLPKETTAYIPKMLALSDIIQHPKRYQINLPVADKRRALAKVHVGQSIELNKLAHLAGVSAIQMKKFNAGYRQGTTSPHGPAYVMVPVAHVEKLKTSLANIGLKKLQSPSQLEALVSKKYYQVQAGDTLSTIAKRSGMTVAQLKRLNTLKNNTLRVGQSLSLNRTTPGNKLLDNASITYRVQKGDSLSSIAQRHGVNINDVMRWNSLTSHEQLLIPGKDLTLFVSNQ